MSTMITESGGSGIDPNGLWVANAGWYVVPMQSTSWNNFVVVTPDSTYPTGQWDITNQQTNLTTTVHNVQFNYSADQGNANKYLWTIRNNSDETVYISGVTYKYSSYAWTDQTAFTRIINAGASASLFWINLDVPATRNIRGFFTASNRNIFNILE